MEKINKSNIEILIPTLNEEGNIQETIKGLQSRNFKNITIIDDNSSDNTTQISKDLGCNVIENEKRLGFGMALIKAFQNSKFEYCCVFDGDNSFNPKDIIKMYEKILLNYDFVFASRYLNNEKSEDDTFVTKFGNYIFTKLVRYLFKIDTSDVLFLFVMGKKKNIRKHNLHQPDFSICTEFVVKAHKNFRCIEIFSKERKRLYVYTFKKYSSS